jgi:hypothetical protein
VVDVSAEPVVVLAAVVLVAPSLVVDSSPASVAQAARIRDIAARDTT